MALAKYAELWDSRKPSNTFHLQKIIQMSLNIKKERLPVRLQVFFFIHFMKTI